MSDEKDQSPPQRPGSSTGDSSRSSAKKSTPAKKDGPAKKRSPAKSSSPKKRSAAAAQGGSTRAAGEQPKPDPADAAEQRSVQQLQAEAAGTREELGETVEALAAKADVKAQARGAYQEQKERVQAQADQLRERVGSIGGEGGGDGPDVTTQLSSAASQAEQQPWALAGGAFALGFVVGRLTKRRRR